MKTPIPFHDGSRLKKLPRERPRYDALNPTKSLRLNKDVSSRWLFDYAQHWFDNKLLTRSRCQISDLGPTVLKELARLNG